MTYENQAQCSGATGVSKEVLKLLKAHGCPGFIAHRINWDVVEPWMKEHEQDIELWQNDSKEALEKERLREDIKNIRLKNLKMEGEYLEPDDVKQFLTGMAVAQSAILKKVAKELPPKLVGKTAGEMEQQLEQAVGAVFKVFQQELDKWIKQ